MKKIFPPTACLLLAVFVLSSCLGGDDDEDTISARETAITAFTLGNMTCSVHTKSSIGTDSVYTVTYTGSTYKFYIDHINRRVYNPDSLPYGTDASNVTCTVAAYNSGYIGIKSVYSDTIRAYSSSEAIDFTTPRLFRIVSRDGTAARDYTVTVNVHKEKADLLPWQQKAAPGWLPAMQGLRALPCGDRMFVFGTPDGTSGTIHSSPLTDGDNWTLATPDINQPLPADIHENVAVKNDVLYLKWDSQLVRSTDGNHWEVAGDISQMTKLIGASSSQLFALGNDGQLYASTDDGATWSAETLDDEAALLPIRDINIVTSPLATDGLSERIILMGNRDVDSHPADTGVKTWVKVYEPSLRTKEWMYVDPTSTPYDLPRMNHLAVVPYLQGLLALGAEGLGACTHPAFSQFYMSNDKGLTWESDSRFTLPTDFDSGNVFAMTVDGDQYIWLFCAGSGQVWRGRLNQAGWQTAEKAITQ